MKLCKGEKLINFACRYPDGTMKPNHDGQRLKLYCPMCRFRHREAGCIFTPAHSSGAAFGKNATAKPRREYAPRRVANNSTGGRWKPEDILEVIIEFYERSGEWPKNTTSFRDSKRLPHSQTVKRYFGSVEEAVKRAQILMEKEG